MKTKFKTSSELQKKSILENSNFLNNQNYVLGESEKKKLLSKFFVENNILFFINCFNYIKHKFSGILATKNNKNLYSKIMGFTLLFAIILLFYLENTLIGLLLFLFIPFFSLLILKYHSKEKLIKYNKKIQITSFKKLIFSKNNSLIGTIILTLFTFLPFIAGIISISEEGFLPLYLILFFIFTIIAVLKFDKNLKILNIFKIKLLFVILLPFFFILELFYGIYIFIKFYIKGNKLFNITKKGFEKNLINKFLLLNENYGENEFYKIELKK